MTDDERAREPRLLLTWGQQLRAGPGLFWTVPETRVYLATEIHEAQEAVRRGTALAAE